MTFLIQGTVFNDFLTYNIQSEVVVFAGEGDDIVYASMDSQTTPSDMKATVNGEGGDDLLMGRGGKDTLRGGSGDDKLFASSDDDYLAGNNGKDDLHGEDGDDTIYGGNHQDTMMGGSGDDKLFGGHGDDYLNGNDGNDYLKGGLGSDTLIGENGTDTFVVTSDDLINVADTDAAADRIIFTTDGKQPDSFTATIEGFSAEDYVQLDTADMGSIISHFTTNNGVGDTLLYISHDDGYLSVIKFTNVDENFVSDRIDALYQSQ